MPLNNAVGSISQDDSRDSKRANILTGGFIVLEDYADGDAEVPVESFARASSRPNAINVEPGALSPLSAHRRTSFVKDAMTDALIRGRSLSPDPRMHLKDLKGQLKSMAMSRSMPNLKLGRSSYNRCIGSILSDVSESSDQVNGKLIASEQAAELDLLLQDIY